MYSCQRSTARAIVRSLASSSTCRVAPRTTANTFVARRTITSSHAPPPPSAGSSHVVAGVAGGSAVLLGVYGYYRYSGAADVVAAAQKTVDTAKALQEKAPSPSAVGKAVVSTLKAVSPGFIAVIPGLDDVINKGIDQLDQLAETHGDQVNDLVHKLYQDLQKLSKKGFNEDTLKQAVSLIQDRLKEAQELAGKIGADATDKVLAANPELKKSVYSGLEELKGMVDVPEAQQILHDTYDELKKMADKGFSPETILAAGLLVKRQVAKAKDLAENAGDAAWDKAAEIAKPYLKKMPEVEKLIEGKLGDIKKLAKQTGGPELEKVITEMYDELKKISEKGVSKDSIQQATKVVETKLAEAAKIASKSAGKAGDLAWDKAAEMAKPYLKKMPEVEKLIDGKLGDLKKLAKENGGPELEKIVTDMYDELKKISDKGVNKDSIQKATKLVETKLAEAAKIASKSAGKAGDVAWDKVTEAAKPYLKEIPDLESKLGDIKKVVEKRGPEGQELLKETYDKLAKIAEDGVSKSSVSQLKKVVEEQAAKAKKLSEQAAKDVKK